MSLKFWQKNNDNHSAEATAPLDDEAITEINSLLKGDFKGTSLSDDRVRYIFSVLKTAVHQTVLYLQMQINHDLISAAVLLKLAQQHQLSQLRANINNNPDKVVPLSLDELFNHQLIERGNINAVFAPADNSLINDFAQREFFNDVYTLIQSSNNQCLAIPTDDINPTTPATITATRDDDYQLPQITFHFPVSVTAKLLPFDRHRANKCTITLQSLLMPDDEQDRLNHILTDVNYCFYLKTSDFNDVLTSDLQQVLASFGEVNRDAYTVTITSLNGHQISEREKLLLTNAINSSSENKKE